MDPVMTPELPRDNPAASQSPLHPALLLSVETLSPSDCMQIRKLSGPLLFTDPFNDSLSSASNPSTSTAPKPSSNPPLPLPTPWGLDVEERQEAWDLLNQHMRARWPSVREASKMVQAATEMRNTAPFEPPQPPSTTPARPVGWSLNPHLRHLLPAGILGPGEGNENFRRTKPEAQRLPRDKGLRETMLMHGRQPYGREKKTELRSLSFHDLTPDLGTGTFRNELLAHFDRQGELWPRMKLVMYEVDVPITLPDRASTATISQPLGPTERWIWFYLAVPLIIFDHNLSASSSFHPGPPNLPQPIPTSWVAFAAPLSNVSVFPTTTDMVSNKIPHPNSDQPVSFRDCPQSSCQESSGSKTKLTQVTRYDYNFSHHGIPVFEFPDKTFILGSANGSIREKELVFPSYLEFLQGTGMPPYDGRVDNEGQATIAKHARSKSIDIAMTIRARADRKEKQVQHTKPYSEDLYNRVHHTQDSLMLPDGGVMINQNQHQRAKTTRPITASVRSSAPTPLPNAVFSEPTPSTAQQHPLVRSGEAQAAYSPEQDQHMGDDLQSAGFEGRWWKEATAAFRRDHMRWQNIREAMARGSCRVVARVEAVDDGRGMRASNGSGNEGVKLRRSGLGVGVQGGGERRV